MQLKFEISGIDVNHKNRKLLFDDNFNKLFIDDDEVTGEKEFENLLDSIFIQPITDDFKMLEKMEQRLSQYGIAGCFSKSIEEHPANWDSIIILFLRELGIIFQEKKDYKDFFSKEFGNKFQDESILFINKEQLNNNKLIDFLYKEGCLHKLKITDFGEPKFYYYMPFGTDRDFPNEKINEIIGFIKNCWRKNNDTRRIY